ncbi:MAG: Fe-S cluster assembly scaffold protein NifU [bacterium]
MAEKYSAKVMDHFANPRNVGEMPDADGIGTVGNPVCGDVMKMYIKVKDDIITDVKFQTFGCGAAIATSSISTEMIIGKNINEALALTNKAVAEALDGLPPIKMHCSMLAEQAVHSAINDYLIKTTGVGLNETPQDPHLACVVGDGGE